ncbi:amidase domain-containing protein [Cryobacterium sp. PH31-AA6]|uniref:amidase domain-containing protein n=1 Tax=Cryobacterium sp. PH31-AA6 TaxID=3046205 RepID=UPI0024BAF16F|nr:amidase domain-containing protein [Cryobacterium sp. PH31-AA6]MDJ0323377.1 amidase domain-containing protein [Cryobacterium sp. PH31-AA6]
MLLTRRFRIGVVVLVLGGLVAGTAAVASLGDDEPSSAARAAGAGDTVTGEASKSKAPTSTSRAVPADAGAPVAVAGEPAPVATVGVQAQVDYMLAHWTDYNTADYGIIGDNDCVNFTSQSLIQRGWAMDDDWWSDGTGGSFTHSSAWISSTSMMRYLASSGRASALTDDQRDEVKLGDVVQFDWDNSGDRDHTGVVTRIEGSGDNIEIFYAGHTDDTDFRSVDYAITEKHPGGTAYYWSIP